MRNPKNLKEVQRLVGRLTSFSQFVPRLAERIKFILKVMKKADKFKWSEECEKTFIVVKQGLAATPILSKPNRGEPLLVYLVVSAEAISATIAQGTTEQRLVYFVSRVLQDTDIRYQMIEKVALALVHTTRKVAELLPKL